MEEIKQKLQRCYYKIKSRCYNPNDNKYKNYGARGIIMCDEWKNKANNFYDWALKNGVRMDLTIDRIDVNGNYEPSNCRWVDSKTQQNNRRDNIFLSYKGKTQSLAQWCDEFNIYYPSVKNRYYFCKKHNIDVDNDVFNAIMKPAFYYRDKQFGDLVLTLNRVKNNKCVNCGKEINDSDKMFNGCCSDCCFICENQKVVILPPIAIKNTFINKTKFEYHQIVYALIDNNIIKGQIDVFDVFTKKYLVYFSEFDLGNEWCIESELFATREEAEAKLKENMK